MRKLMLLALVVLLLLGFVAVPVSAGRDQVSPFVGHWKGIDGDGSRMIINISAGTNGVTSVFFKDFGASACGIDAGTGVWLYAGQAKFFGVVDGDDLLTYGRGGMGVGNGAIWCMANPPFVLVGPSEEPTPFVTYDPGTDTLSLGPSSFYRVRSN